MHQGKIMSLNSPQKLISQYVGIEVWEAEVNPEEKEVAIEELERRGLDFEDAMGKIHVFNIESAEPLAGIAGFSSELKRRSATLEDVFFRLTGRSLLE